MTTATKTQATYDSWTNPLSRLLCAGPSLAAAFAVAQEFGISASKLNLARASILGLDRFVQATLNCTFVEIADEITAWEQRMLTHALPGTAEWFANFRAEVQMGPA